eukprot:6483003-Amphidinium_carterae.1
MGSQVDCACLSAIVSLLTYTCQALQLPAGWHAISQEARARSGKVKGKRGRPRAQPAVADPVLKKPSGKKPSRK